MMPLPRFLLDEWLARVEDPAIRLGPGVQYR